jgi:hypothetical protein
MQIIVTGDFFQLPPVTTSGQPKFAFEAKAWEECISRTVNLTQVYVFVLTQSVCFSNALLTCLVSFSLASDRRIKVRFHLLLPFPTQSSFPLPVFPDHPPPSLRFALQHSSTC